MELCDRTDFSSYSASLDASLKEKLKDILPWLTPGLVVDRGCGSGGLIRELATLNIPAIGVELSDSLSKRHVGVIRANAAKQLFMPGVVSTVIFSSVMHEIYSYNNYSKVPVIDCLFEVSKELGTGGRLIIRDIWSPEPLGPKYLLHFDEERQGRLQTFLAKNPENNWFSHIDSSGVLMDERTAVEFLSKKEYIRNFAVEIQEIYTCLPLSFYKNLVDTLPFKLLYCAPLLNPWIVENFWKMGTFGEFPPYTNQMIVFEKI